LVSLARNRAFVWAMLAASLTLLAARPARTIAAVAGPALLSAALAVAVNLPAAFIGQASAPLRVGAKTLVTITLTCLVARTTTPETLLGGLSSLGLPRTVTFTIDLAIRDLALIGTEAQTLTEALELRCVGRNRHKTGSTAGIIGTCLLKAARHAREQAEAMTLRGFDGSAPAKRLDRPGAYDACYACVLALMVSAFAYLELAS
jgi:energy-coupling factor transporter transmembrane protein EcfT